MNDNENKIKNETENEIHNNSDGEIDDDFEYIIDENFDKILKQVLWEIYEEEFAEFNDPENLSEFKPSLRHRLAMKRIFKRYERNVRKLKKKEAAEKHEQYEYIPYYSLKQRIVIALVIVVLMTLITGWYIPIRSITQAQVDWLRSKYDFPNMKTMVSDMDGAVVNNSGSGQVIGVWKQTDEYLDFLDDLVVLGIYSEEEMTIIQFRRAPADMRPVPDNVEVHFVQVTPCYEEQSPLESSREYVLKVEDRIESYKNRAKDPEKAREGDEEFAKLIEEFLPLPKSFLNLLEKLYAEIPDNGENQRNFLSELDKDSRKYLSEIHKV